MREGIFILPGFLRNQFYLIRVWVIIFEMFSHQLMPISSLLSHAAWCHFYHVFTFVISFLFSISTYGECIQTKNNNDKVVLENGTSFLLLLIIGQLHYYFIILRFFSVVKFYWQHHHANEEIWNDKFSLRSLIQLWMINLKRVFTDYLIHNVS